ncbi:ABCB family ABC transporter ATP-binding protein/permease [Thiorhodovibrio frisius]|uniref:Fused permease/ATPase component of ABC transporter involved in Fe-S cluster assembly n=1 Tax=Thiorhodovibrio frisius TaxID=631362 RepID=H8YY41_9GAMM|nr:ABC transporter ATP-binding protein/permease [Thiorhodovibrio frisius]EIC23367.1 fused permease/ATPase component of ABC transporter involved in Fe-S cluster assembly [Thiorhodovibrio frisius]WPL23552.1 Putative multidrug export ATP-binding/permease protein [Thiorhodovibrio frisius]
MVNPGRIFATERVHNDRRDWRNLREMLPYLWEFRGRALLALTALVLAKFANVGVPMVFKEIVDAFEGRQAQLLVLPVSLLLLYGALKLSSSLFNELRDVVFARVRFRAMRRLSTRVLEHLHRLSLRYHLERQSGAISRDLERGTRSVSTILNYMVFSVIPVLVEFSLVAAVLLTKYALVFTLVTFSTVLVYVGFTFAITEWRMDYRHQMNRLDSHANTQAFDSLLNYETVKYFGNESMELERYDGTLSQWEDYAVKSQSSMSLLNFGQGSIIALGVTGIMFFAAQGVVAGRMSIGDLVLVNALMLQLFIPLGFLGIVYRQIKYALADMDLVVKLLARVPEVQDAPTARPLCLNAGGVRFEQVSFDYQPERPILRSVDFAIAPGEKVAVVGHSGAGKSTLARLLFRFYDVTDGRILVDGQDIREVTQQSLRAAIGIVPQDTVLFNDSILYNLSYGRPDATSEEIERAAELAHIRDFIESLPNAWETIVGERGLKLSGGEKQRVAIARTILKRPRILVFDEATSSLDSRTEQAIQQTLAEVAENHSTLVIAHRLSTIVDADRILVMDSGGIIEQGHHRDLLAAGGTYATMWELQLREREQQTTEEPVPQPG